MASFTVFINNLPSINLSVFKVSAISEAINILLFGNSNRIIVNGYFDNNLPSDNTHNISKSKNQLSMRGNNKSNPSYEKKSHHGTRSREYHNNHDSNRSKSSVYLPGAGAAWYGMNKVNISLPPRNSGISSTSILSNIYNEQQFKQSVNKENISYPYNARGTLLSNRGTNVWGYPQMGYIKPDNSELGTINIKLDITPKENISNEQYTGITRNRDTVSLDNAYNKNSFQNPVQSKMPDTPSGSYYYNEELISRKNKILEAINNRETIIGKRSSLEKFTFTGANNSHVELSLNYLGSRGKKGVLDSIFIKFYEKGMRTYQWCAWESQAGHFKNYKEFKKFWDIRGSTLIDLNKKTGCSIKDIVSELVRIRDPFKK